MSKKINEKFLKLYTELDIHCCERTGVNAGGVTEYINRLESAKFAPNRDKTLEYLNKYRNFRNSLAHDAKAMKKNDMLTKGDLKWVKRFIKSLKKKKDPVSVYLNKARKFVKNRRGVKIAVAVVVAAAAAAVAGAKFLDI